MQYDQLRWVRGLSRMGWAAKGVVFLVIGALTSLAAFGLGGKVSSKDDAFRWIIGLPLGRALLALVTIGLLAYVLWRFIQAVADPEKKGTDLKGIVQRMVMWRVGWPTQQWLTMRQCSE